MARPRSEAPSGAPSKLLPLQVLPCNGWLIVVDYCTELGTTTNVSSFVCLVHLLQSYNYSGTPLLWTPWGPGEVSYIEKCPHSRGNF